ncbi:iron-sulfur cluster biosynthesis family protein [Paenibacillus sp. HJGM_3]|uniref:iron-sulfur cluster biosynthesis family protein n=1 Tax=Paenibacillus sp. HJGM_3 TaxID=3379816 RepID=UPI00385AC75F
MQITLTQAAREQLGQELAAKSPEAPIALKLAYDAEGCGCAVDGVTALWLVDGPEPDDRVAGGSAFNILYDKKHEVFFEDELTVDYSDARRAYTLRSKQQTYNSMMRLIDKRHTS